MIKININMRVMLISFTFLFVGSLTSCQKFLEVKPGDRIDAGTLWSDQGAAGLFLNGMYTGLPSYFNQFDPDENFTDDALNGVANQSSANVYALSIYDASNAPDKWGFYNYIRKANVFIENVKKSKLNEAWKTQSIAEARFLRAYYYSLLWNYYGGVPLIDEVLDRHEQGDKIFRERNSSDEIVSFITKECSEIYMDLPLNAPAGKATRGAALTLKGWVELFWASPLYNPDNAQQRWVDAAESYRKVIDLNNYSLFNDYRGLFLEDNNSNPETIFARQFLGGTSIGSSNEGYHGPAYTNSGTMIGWGLLNPTQEIVDQYFMANGLAITDPSSGYDPQKPYINREKRFYQSVLFDGAEWRGENLVMKQGVGSKNATDLNSSSEVTNTGYYLLKGLNPKYTVPGNNQLSSANSIIFRYAEVLLGFAEAENEVNGPTNDVYNAIDLVRKRAEIPLLLNIAPSLSKAAMRAAILHERRVELAFEGRRWFDLMRLKIAEDKLNGNSHAVVITKDGNNWRYDYPPAVGGKRVFFQNKNYVLPIPQSALDQNSKLKQNPNY
ncbi:MAG: RagB/SusD family nutrient uptake outer membrane protein [Ginsengibacter sp.]